MLAWRHAGFSVHNEVRVAAEDAERRRKLAGYMLRAPMSLEKMTYDVATGSVIYRSKMHASLKRNFQVPDTSYTRTTAAMPWRYCTSDSRRLNSFLTTA